ncbi:unnamed protein product [Brassica oleracea var. botrytis]
MSLFRLFFYKNPPDHLVEISERVYEVPYFSFPHPKTEKHTRLNQQEECTPVKLDIQYCRVQGDVVLECIILHDDLVREEMVFRVMFNTAFVRGNVLIVQRDEMDMLWDAKDQFPKEFN